MLLFVTLCVGDHVAVQLQVSNYDSLQLDTFSICTYASITRALMALLEKIPIVLKVMESATNSKRSFLKTFSVNLLLLRLISCWTLFHTIQGIIMPLISNRSRPRAAHSSEITPPGCILLHSVQLLEEIE